MRATARDAIVVFRVALSPLIAGDIIRAGVSALAKIVGRAEFFVRAIVIRLAFRLDLLTFATQADKPLIALFMRFARRFAGIRRKVTPIIVAAIRVSAASDGRAGRLAARGGYADFIIFAIFRHTAIGATRLDANLREVAIGIFFASADDGCFGASEGVGVAVFSFGAIIGAGAFRRHAFALEKYLPLFTGKFTEMILRVAMIAVSAFLIRFASVGGEDTHAARLVACRAGRAICGGQTFLVGGGQIHARRIGAGE